MVDAGRADRFSRLESYADAPTQWRSRRKPGIGRFSGAEFRKLSAIASSKPASIRMRDQTVAIIPARGGSKRVPRKNILPLAGKPLIAYTIEAALESALFHRVVVSTDSEEIAAVARITGAEVPFLRSAD